MKRFLLSAALAIAISFLLPKNIYARSGCCSHHGGVCGCGCCDGTPLSSTCAPYYPECSRPVYIAPTVTKVPTVYTPKPTTPKPTVFPTQIPILIQTVEPTSSPTLPTSEPEVKSAATSNNTPIPTTQPEKAETSSKDALLGLGILATMAGGSIWIIKKVLRKIKSIFNK